MDEQVRNFGRNIRAQMEHQDISTAILLKAGARMADLELEAGRRS